MAGPREAKLVDLVFAPGYVTNLTDRDAVTRWKDGNRVRFHKSAPEKIGGFERITLTGANGGVMMGTVRALHDWTSLDTQQWIAAGSECKLYLVNTGQLHDITPLRKASNIVNPFTTTNGSAIVTVADVDHRANEGDHITVFSSIAVGGLTLSGAYTIVTVLTPDSYTITAASNATSGATGGGSTTIEYDISCGLATNGELLGYGTGDYGEGTYGTARAVGTGVPAKMRTWSLDNWGEDLVASFTNGELYWWDKTNGPNSRATLVTNAPTDIQRILVNPENRHLIAIGCSGLDGVADPMRVRWCEQENFDEWTPSALNTAGGKRLDYGSRLIAAVKSRSQNYLWSDTQMYAMQYVGPDVIFTFNPLGACKIVGPNAAVDVNGVVFFMVFDDFMIYDGTLRVLECDVHTRIFGDEDRNVEGDFDRTQAEGVYCASYMAKNEVTWFHPTTASTIRYVTYNYALNCWYYGQMTRTAYHDVSEAITGYKTNPYAVNGGYLYKHEVGTDEVEGATVTPQDWFLESYDNHIGGSDAVMLINAITPNFDRMSGTMSMLVRAKAYPREPTYRDKGPYTITAATLDIGVRQKGSQIALRLSSNDLPDEDFRLGTFQVLVTPYGGRTGANAVVLATVTPPVLSGEIVTTDDGSLTWTAATVSGATITGYTIYRKVGAAAFALLTTVSGSTLIYSDANLTIDVTYQYYVVAHASNGNNSVPSNTVSLSYASDPEFEDVVVLLTADTGSLVEWSGLPTTAVIGGGAVSAAQIKFGTASFRNPGTDFESLNYVRLQDASASQGLFVFPGEFTIEGWFFMVGYNTNQFENLFANSINFPGAGFTQLAIYNSGADHRLFWNSSPGTSIIGSTNVPLGQWVHLAVTRNASNILRMWQAGAQVGTATFSGTVGALNPSLSSLDCCRGHAADNSDADCYFDQIRMTKACRYTADFSVPTQPFPKS